MLSSQKMINMRQILLICVLLLARPAGAQTVQIGSITGLNLEGELIFMKNSETAAKLWVPTKKEIKKIIRNETEMQYYTPADLEMIYASWALPDEFWDCKRANCYTSFIMEKAYHDQSQALIGRYVLVMKPLSKRQLRQLEKIKLPIAIFQKGTFVCFAEQVVLSPCRTKTLAIGFLPSVVETMTY